MKSLISNFLRTKFAQNLIARLAFLYIKFVYLTSSWEYKNKDIVESYLNSNKPFIMSFWHGHLLMLACAWQWQTPFYMLISNHRDGKIIAKTMAYFNIKTITGSTDKQGFQAAKKIITTIKNNCITGITPDGPRGPSEEISAGVLQLSRLAKVDILPIAFSTNKLKILKTWDKFRIAIPFSKGIFVIGKPISPSSNLELMKIQLQQSMLKTTKEADKISLKKS